MLLLLFFIKNTVYGTIEVYFKVSKLFFMLFPHVL